MNGNNKWALALIGGCMAAGICGTGCKPATHTANTATIDSIRIDTTLVLDPKAKTSPSCKIDISLMYLKTGNKKDTLTGKINQAFMKAISEKIDKTLPPRFFADSLTNRFIADYKQDIQEFYRADEQSGTTQDEVSAWYSYAYSVTTTLQKGREGVWVYDVTNFQYTGGAHPYTWSQWVNVDAATGKVLASKDVFLPNTEKAICSLLQQKLIEETNNALDTDTITSLDGLHSVGVLLEGDLYIPDNFQLGKEGITFLYNPYDIAPYSMGEIRLTLPYADLKNYLILK